MEIYRNDTTTQVFIDVPGTVTPTAGTMDVSAKDRDTVLYTFDTVTATTGGYYVTLPFSLVSFDRDFTIEWAFSYQEGSQTQSFLRVVPVSVVTPYATLGEIKEVLGTEAAKYSDTELERAERIVRKVIDTYTSQSFGRYTGTLDVIARGDTELSLPRRLISATAISHDTVVDTVTDFEITGDGWYLAISPTIDSVGTYSYLDGNGNLQTVISDPYTVATQSFADNIVYTISGTWGYDDVPVDIKEAALIIIEDRLDPNSEYRDRYVDSISASDWSYKLRTDSFNGTGSVVADQLLDAYTVQRFLVI
jgi:hypothetical protein